VHRIAPAGIGWRQPHYGELLERRPALGFIEVHSENFFADGGGALALLEQAREHYLVSLHGVGLSLGSAAGLDPWHLDRLDRLVRRIDPVRVSDHACFARAPRARGTPPVHANDLLPVAFTAASLDVMAANVEQVQERLKRPILVENLSAYVGWADDAMPEPEFFNRLSRRTGCGLLLDVNNLVVNALNAGTDPVAAACAFVDAIDADAVGEIHLAGYDASGPLVIDDHGSRVHAPVWQVYRHAIARLGQVPTLIEWDTGVPALDVLLDEAALAHEETTKVLRGSGSAGPQQEAPRGAATGGSVAPKRHPRRMDLRHQAATADPAPPVRRLRPPGGGAEGASGGSQDALRQQMLVRALWRDAPSGVLSGWLSDSVPPARGLAAYRANAGASAERALAAAFPTLEQLVGAESFAALARAFWHAHPPQRGDLAEFGETLPAFIAGSPSLADEPYLADSARLDWAVHRAEHAADPVVDPAGLERLAQHEPARLTLRLQPGTALVSSAHPIATVWHAHRSDAADRFAPVRAAFATAAAEHALVWRDGWRARVQSIPSPDAAFTHALLEGASLAHALQTAGDGFDFEPWLLDSLRERRIAGAALIDGDTP